MKSFPQGKNKKKHFVAQTSYEIVTTRPQIYCVTLNLDEIRSRSPKTGTFFTKVGRQPAASSTVADNP